MYYSKVQDNENEYIYIIIWILLCVYQCMREDGCQVDDNATSLDPDLRFCATMNSMHLSTHAKVSLSHFLFLYLYSYIIIYII